MTEAVFFPEIEGPEFIRSAEIGEVADAVIKTHGRGGVGTLSSIVDLRKAVEGEELHVLYLVNAKPFDPLKDDITHDTIAKAIKAPRLWRDVTGYDAVVWVRGYFWNAGDDRWRSAVMLHELLHLEARVDDNEAWSIRIRKHDVEDFISVVRFYGPLDQSRVIFAKALLAWETDQPVEAPTSVPAANGKAKLKAVPDPDADVRPTGEVNPEALRGEADRSILPDTDGPVH